MTARFSKTQWFLLAAALLSLRLAIGAHFYVEGTTKLKDGNFSAEPFLKAATGPIAPLFADMLEDPDGRQLLCVQKVIDDSGETELAIDPTRTFQLWDDFADQAVSYYRFGDPELIDEIQKRREFTAKLIREAREQKNRSVDTARLEEQRKQGEEAILSIRDQLNALDDTLNAHKDELKLWLDANRVELIAHFQTQNRLEGFDRDGAAKARIAEEVESIRQQVSSIRSDRAKKLAGWKAEVKAIWDSFESSVDQLRVDQQKTQTPISIHRPFDQLNSKLKWINTVIPWFDTVIGVLLLLGLFTRLASSAAALFLLSVIATQPPWIASATPTFYQMIEMFGLVVLAVAGAGRFMGIDAIFSSRAPAASPDTNL